MPKTKKMFDNGHWIHTEQLDPENYFGFIYWIDNNINGRSYIGKKQYFSYHKRKKLKEMNWRTYISSSVELKRDIKTFGKENFTFKIICQCKTRAALTYAEANLQHKYDVLVKPLRKGSDEKKFYNKNIGGIKFIPALDVLPKEVL